MQLTVKEQEAVRRALASNKSVISRYQGPLFYIWPGVLGVCYGIYLDEVVVILAGIIVFLITLVVYWVWSAWYSNVLFGALEKYEIEVGALDESD